ncbi:MAG TPA: hypothetical protein VLB47_06280, partial [Solirubrobacteraceae bacterium]|nr:hypothetical protein [Solirubrobacteraceae bacterium]
LARPPARVPEERGAEARELDRGLCRARDEPLSGPAAHRATAVAPRDAIGGAVASGHDHPRPASIAVVAGRVRHADAPAAVAR